MKGSMAVDRMTRAQLWRVVWRRFYEIEPYNSGGFDLRERQLQWRALQKMLLELELRGDQLALGDLGREEVARHGHIDR